MDPATNDSNLNHKQTLIILLVFPLFSGNPAFKLASIIVRDSELFNSKSAEQDPSL